MGVSEVGWVTMPPICDHPWTDGGPQTVRYICPLPPLDLRVADGLLRRVGSPGVCLSSATPRASAASVFPRRRSRSQCERSERGTPGDRWNARSLWVGQALVLERFGLGFGHGVGRIWRQQGLCEDPSELFSNPSRWSGCLAGAGAVLSLSFLMGHLRARKTRYGQD